jgi:SCF-associated factor 1
MMHITDIPVDIFLDNLFPFAEVRDVLSLGSTNKFFAALCADEAFWRTRCREEFNFTSQETARQSGWKNLYRGLNCPRVFVWGSVFRLVHRSQVVTHYSDPSNGRLGSRNHPYGYGPSGQGIPYPVEVKIPGCRIVSLAAGGT